MCARIGVLESPAVRFSHKTQDARSGGGLDVVFLKFAAFKKNIFACFICCPTWISSSDRVWSCFVSLTWGGKRAHRADMFPLRESLA